MKAWVISNQSELGVPNVKLVDMPKPEPGNGEVLIAVRAVGLNPADYKLAQQGFAAWEYPHILGLDMAGEVAAVGEGVEEFSIGERVAAHIDLGQQGCFAEFATAPTYVVSRIPDNVSFEEAAGLLSTGITAYQALHRKANLSNRKSVLIHAGSGGVGSMAIQLAKHAGLTVFTTVPGNRLEFAKRLGADIVVDFETENIADVIQDKTDGLGVDLIINTLGQSFADRDLDLLAFNGDLVCIVAPPSQEAMNKLFYRGLGVHLAFVGAAHQSGNMQQKQDLGQMTKEVLSLVSEEKLRVPIARSFKFSDLSSALTTLEKEPPAGKFVVQVN